MLVTKKSSRHITRCFSSKKSEVSYKSESLYYITHKSRFKSCDPNILLAHIMVLMFIFSMKELAFHKYQFLAKLGLKEDNLGCWNGKAWVGHGSTHTAINPATGEKLARVKFGNEGDYEDCLKNMAEAEDAWMMTPAPRRGEIVRQIGVKLRDFQDELGSLVSLEMGKIKSEGLGEVQEYIDMCDLAVGMSRQIPGQVLPSER